MIHYTKFVKYHSELVGLTRISLTDARYFYSLGYDIYIVQDLSVFDRLQNLRLFFCANKMQGIKNFDDVCKVFRVHYKVKKSRTLMYFILEQRIKI